MVRIKFHGMGYLFHYLESSPESISLYRHFANKLNLPLFEALLDARFYQHIQLDPEDIQVYTLLGIPPTTSTQMEIWLSKKKLAKHTTESLLSTTTLFPLFRTKIYDFSDTTLESGFYLKEKIIGCLGIFEIPCDSFAIDDLQFEFLNSLLHGSLVLTRMQYQGIGLKKIKDDCLIQHQEIIWIP